MTPQLDRHIKTDPNRKCYELSKPDIEFNVIKEMYGALGMHTCSEKMTSTTKRTKPIREWGKVIMGLGVPLPNHMPACRSELISYTQPR